MQLHFTDLVIYCQFLCVAKKAPHITITVMCGAFVGWRWEESPPRPNGANCQCCHYGGVGIGIGVGNGVGQVSTCPVAVGWKIGGGG